tara:strand:- start:528 stop:1388 length:861 start_codon:yes stop_codon:yes gene_type:complete
MIVSDSHKFIFFHVPKTAGTSLACKLAPYSNNKELLFPYYELHIQDIIAERYSNDENVRKIVAKIPKGSSTDFYEDYPEKISWMNLPHFMFDPHYIIGYDYPSGKNTGPIDYLNKNADKFSSYCKFAIVRNSWDYVFSIFKNKIAVAQVAKKWDKSMDWDAMVEEQINKKAFLNFMHNIQTEHPNLFDIYFYNKPYKLNMNQQVFFCDANMKSYADRILSFERLNEGLDEISNIINLDIRQIPKCNISGKKRNPNYYVDFYDNKSKKLVEDIFKLDIERFDFKFGE